MSFARRITGAMLAMGMVLTGVGCSTYFAVEGQQELASANTVVSGIVATDQPYDAPIIVGLVDAGEQPVLVDYFVATAPGRFIFPVEPGSYRLAAFVDLNRNGQYDNEPALQPSEATRVTIGSGETRNGLDLLIPSSGRFSREHFTLNEIMSRDSGQQERISLYSLCAIGEVTTLDDERFSRPRAQAGMWKFYDFLLENRCGIYFLQPYDPDKVPVLFVHGLAGTPTDFADIIANLDTERFQAWVFYYPSGGHLENIAALLLQLVHRLHLEHGFESLHVVAHSMGGLVSRECVLQASELNAAKLIRSFTTISSPLGGMATAGLGVERSPVVVSSWRGLDPKGAFQENLFYKSIDGKRTRRMIPDKIPYHLLFGYRGDSGDGVVSLTSQLRYEAQQEAESIRGFHEDHQSILKSPEVIDYLIGILDAE